MTKTFGNLIAAEMAALKADLARVTAERDALNIEIEQAHCFLDECYINDPDALDAGTKPLVDRIGDLDAAHGAEVEELRNEIDKLRAIIVNAQDVIEEVQLIDNTPDDARRVRREMRAALAAAGDA